VELFRKKDSGLRPIIPTVGLLAIKGVFTLLSFRNSKRTSPRSRKWDGFRDAKLTRFGSNAGSFGKWSNKEGESMTREARLMSGIILITVARSTWIGRLHDSPTLRGGSPLDGRWRAGRLDYWAGRSALDSRRPLLRVLNFRCFH